MCTVIGVAVALCAFAGAAIPEGIALGTSCVVAVWCAVADGGRAARTGAILMAGALLGTFAVQASQNWSFNLALLAFTAFAARAWQAHGRAEQEALTETEQLQLHFASSFDATLAAGRLAFTRTIHDAASHAVGAMAMQSTAALALHENNPEAARTALKLVCDMGCTAALELSVLAATAADPAESSAPGSSAPQSFQAVMDQVAAVGSPVVLGRVGTVPRTHAGVPYRISREALFNAARHAPGSPATLSIVTTGAGFGLQGLHELASSTSGTLKSGPIHGATKVNASAGCTSQGEVPASGFQQVAVLPAVPTACLREDA